jgi:hypothetical protein
MATLDQATLTERLFIKATRGDGSSRCLGCRSPTAGGVQASFGVERGVSLPGDEHFAATLQVGDASFRDVPADTDAALLVENHRSKSFDHSGMRPEEVPRES